MTYIAFKMHVQYYTYDPKCTSKVLQQDALITEAETQGFKDQWDLFSCQILYYASEGKYIIL